MDQDYGKMRIENRNLKFEKQGHFTVKGKPCQR